MSDEIKLLSCPFCGEEESLYPLHIDADLACYVRCGSCQAKGPRARSNIFDHRIPKDEDLMKIAREKWNERVK